MPVPTPTSSTRSSRLDVHPLDGLQTSGVERRSEEQVVDLGELVVDTFDEIVLDCRGRECPGRGIRPCDQLLVLFGFPLE